MALSAGLPIFSKKCSQCGSNHLDRGVFTGKADKKHVCTYGKIFIGCSIALWIVFRRVYLMISWFSVS